MRAALTPVGDKSAAGWPRDGAVSELTQLMRVRAATLPW